MARKPKNRRRLAAAPPPTPDAVAEAAAQLGRSLTAEQAERLTTYLELLGQWNVRMNLVGPYVWQKLLSELIADSWHLADFLDSLLEVGALPAEPLILDLGAGAGLPGIPTRILWPRGAWHMVELREKRSVFLRVALSKLELPRTYVHNRRAEELPAELHRAHVVMGRAFLPWPELVELSRGLLAPDGLVLVFALQPPPDELPQDIRLVGSHAYPAPDGRERHLWALASTA